MRIKEIVVLSDVLDDLNDGKAFYDQREPGVGDYFWDTLISDIESLWLYAGIHKKIGKYYRMLSRRFPYAIYYQINDDIAQVIAILPMRRNPVWTRKKIGKRNG